MTWAGTHSEHARSFLDIPLNRTALSNAPGDPCFISRSRHNARPDKALALIRQCNAFPAIAIRLQSFTTRKIDQDDIRVLTQTVEYDFLPVPRDVEGPHSRTVLKARRWPRLPRSKIE